MRFTFSTGTVQLDATTRFSGMELLSFVGGSGADRVTGGNGNDSFLDGGTDALAFGRDGSVILDLTDQRKNAGEADGLRVSGFEIYEGSSGDDELRGSRKDETLIGGEGGDVLSGRGGNDTPEGGEGADLLTGGTGADRFVFDVGNARSGTEIHGGGNVIFRRGFDSVGTADQIADFSRTERDKLVISRTAFGIGATDDLNLIRDKDVTSTHSKPRSSSRPIRDSADSTTTAHAPMRTRC